MMFNEAAIAETTDFPSLKVTGTLLEDEPACLGCALAQLVGLSHSMGDGKIINGKGKTSVEGQGQSHS